MCHQLLDLLLVDLLAPDGPDGLVAHVPPPPDHHVLAVRHEELHLDHGLLLALLDKVRHGGGPPQHARLARQAEADPVHDGRLAGAVGADDDVQVGPGLELGVGVLRQNGQQCEQEADRENSLSLIDSLQCVDYEGD